MGNPRPNEVRCPWCLHVFASIASLSGHSQRGCPKAPPLPEPQDTEGESK